MQRWRRRSDDDGPVAAPWVGASSSSFQAIPSPPFDQQQPALMGLEGQPFTDHHHAQMQVWRSASAESALVSDSPEEMLLTSDDVAVRIDSDDVMPGWDQSGADPDGVNPLSTDEDFGALLLQGHDNVLENDGPLFKIAGADWDLPSRRPNPHAGQQPSARRHGARTDEQDPAVLDLETL